MKQIKLCPIDFQYYTSPIQTRKKTLLYKYSPTFNTTLVRFKLWILEVKDRARPSAAFNTTLVRFKHLFFQRVAVGWTFFQYYTSPIQTYINQDFDSMYPVAFQYYTSPIQTEMDRDRYLEVSSLSILH